MMNSHEDLQSAYDQQALLKDFEKLMTIAERVGSTFLGNEAFDQLAYQTRIEYKKIIPRLPYVGDEKSQFTNLMIQSGQTIAFYKACKKRGIEKRMIGEMMYQIAKAQTASISRIRKWFARQLLYTRIYRNRWRRAMEESQSREYPMNWYGKFVEGRPNDFAFGFDFLECGFLKLARKFECKEIVPYACLCDFARLREIGAGFKRTQTLAMGHTRCDFRFSKSFETPSGWPPESLEEVRHSPFDIVTL
ncbi:MAG: L-2-amino-thiazoline-4-carboxylic acid hydrolase [Candidatus Thorarchaeota archaeon]